MINPSRRLHSSIEERHATIEREAQVSEGSSRSRVKYPPRLFDQLISFLFQDSGFVNHSLNGFCRQVGAPTRSLKRLRSGVQVKNQSEAVGDLSGLLCGENMQSSQQTLRHRHFHLSERLSGSRSAFVLIQQPIHPEFGRQLLPSSSNARNGSELSIEHRKNDNCFALTLCLTERRGNSCKRIRFCPKSPNRPSRGGSDQNAQTGNHKRDNCHDDGRPRGCRRVRLPPNSAILCQRPTLADPIQHAHSLIPLWIGRHSAMGETWLPEASDA